MRKLEAGKRKRSNERIILLSKTTAANSTQQIASATKFLWKYVVLVFIHVFANFVF